MTDKQIAADALGRLPETITLAEIAEELQLIVAIRQGQADVAAGRVHTHKEVEQLFASWIQRWTTKRHASS